MTRVAAYCRVSTDKTDQAHSFISQKLYFSDYIMRSPDWTLAEIYADEGITGTTTADRTGFLKMMDDAFSGKFDIIITKEVSRFSRNILDAISFTRRLSEMGVGVIFLNDGISTLETDAELRLGIMASVAQEESRKTSERVRWGQMRKMEQGIVFGRSLLGYDVKNGRISIEPEGAETVRYIFQMYLGQRMGIRAIADVLTANSVPSKTGSTSWTGATVLKIIRNEKYCGDLIQRKTVTTNYLTHKKKRNDVEDQIYIRDHHEPIISREEWEAAQAELRRRAPLKNKSESNGNRYALSGKIFCAVCLASYICRTRKRKDNSTYRVWSCSRCTCHPVHSQLREDDVTDCVRHLIASMGSDQLTEGMGGLVQKIMRVHGASEAAYEKDITVLKRKKLRLIDTFLAGDISDEEYFSLKSQYENELVRIERLLEQFKAASADRRVEEIMQTIGLLASGKDKADDFFLSLVERIEVVNPTEFDFFFKGSSGKWKFICLK